MRPGKICSVKKVEQWKQFHHPKMLCCSIVNELLTKLAFGVQVIRLSRRYPVQKDMAGN